MTIIICLLWPYLLKAINDILVLSRHLALAYSSNHARMADPNTPSCDKVKNSIKQLSSSCLIPLIIKLVRLSLARLFQFSVIFQVRSRNLSSELGALFSAPLGQVLGLLIRLDQSLFFKMFYKGKLLHSFVSQWVCQYQTLKAKYNVSRLGQLLAGYLRINIQRDSGKHRPWFQVLDEGVWD